MRRLKSILIIVFIFCFVMSTFGAIVFDNDGSTFITKAEFDSLKSNFSSQIDNYNSSISGKIDGAIANYLEGIKTLTVNNVNCNITALTWPIKVIDSLNVIEKITTSSTDKTADTPIWNISYDIWAIGGRGSNYEYSNTYPTTWPAGLSAKLSGYYLTLENMKNAHVDKVQDYLNGTRNGNYFKVNNLCKNPVLTVSTGFIHENMDTHKMWKTTDPDPVLGLDGVYTVIDADQKSHVSNRTTSSSTALQIKIRPNIASDYYFNWNTGNFTKDNSPRLDLEHWATYIPYVPTYAEASGAGATKKTLYSYISNKKMYDEMGTYTVTIWHYRNGIGKYDPYQLWGKTYTYTNGSLDRIYNYADSTNNSHFAPVTYDNNLYITNKQANRIITETPNSTRVCWQQRTKYNPADMPFGFKYFISEGSNLEHEAENTTRNWYNKSLISQARLQYDYKLPNGSAVGGHFMTQGIPIYYHDVNRVGKNISVELNFTSQTGKDSNPKYVIFSKSPITTQKYNDDVESVGSYIKILNANPTANKRKSKLNEGVNNLILDPSIELQNGDTLFVKILWNDNDVAADSGLDDEMITLEKPKITFYTE